MDESAVFRDRRRVKRRDGRLDIRRSLDSIGVSIAVRVTTSSWGQRMKEGGDRKPFAEALLEHCPDDGSGWSEAIPEFGSAASWGQDEAPLFRSSARTWRRARAWAATRFHSAVSSGFSPTISSSE